MYSMLMLCTVTSNLNEPACNISLYSALRLCSLSHNVTMWGLRKPWHTCRVQSSMEKGSCAIIIIWYGRFALTLEIMCFLLPHLAHLCFYQEFDLPMCPTNYFLWIFKIYCNFMTFGCILTSMFHIYARMYCFFWKYNVSSHNT